MTVSHASTPRPRVAILANGALLLGTMAVVTFLAEMAVRLVAPQQLIQIRPDVWVAMDTIGYRFRSHLDTRINTGERTVDLVTDADGLRVGARGRTDAETRILLMGDSFLAALQVQHEESLAGLLEDSLYPMVGRPVSVRNSSVPGWGPAEYYYRAVQLLDREPFALLVVGVYLGNDAVVTPLEPRPPVTPIIYHRFRLPRRLSIGEFVDSFLRPINDLVETRSHLYVLTKQRLKTLRMRLGLSPEYFPLEFHRSEADAPRWANTAGMLGALAEAARVRDVPTVFALIPTPFQVDSAVFMQHLTAFDIDPATVDLAQPTRILADMLAARGLEVVDARPAFLAAHSKGVRLFGSVDQHLSLDGHLVLWRGLAPRIAAHLAGPTARADEATGP